MNSFQKGLCVGSAAGLAGMSAYLTTQAARRQLDRGLARVERAASEAQHVLNSTAETLAHTQRAVRNIREAVTPTH
jgi:hypothetical protein